MNAMTGCRRFGVVLGLALCGITANAAVDPESVSWKWDAHSGQGASVLDALDWFDSSNWNGDPVNSTMIKADLTGNPTSTRYIKIDRAVDVASIVATAAGTILTNTAQKVVVVSDHDFRIYRDSSLKEPQPHGIMFYADFSTKGTVYPKSLILCGDFGTAEGAAKGLPLACGNPIEMRADLYAKSSDPVRENAFGFTSTTLNAGDLTLVAPRGSSEAVVGTWSQTKDSPYIVRTGAAHVLCAGTVVSGAGIGEGTFVKRIFPDGIVELSAVATETIADNELTFAAFSPKVSHTCSINTSQDGSHNLCLVKWRDEDEFVLTVTAMTSSKAASIIVFDVKEGALPATAILKSGAGMKGGLRFVNCRIQFGAEGQVSGPNFAEVSSARVPYWDSKARLSVPEGLTAGIANFDTIAGTLTKEGAGTLTLDLTGPAENYTGSVIVKDGVLAFTGEGELYVKTLAISNGATFHVPEGGLRCDSFLCEPGATVSGPGTITVPALDENLLNVTCTDGAKVVYADTTHTGTIVFAPPAPGVPGNPALWFDASRTDTFDYAPDEGGVNRISKWNDVRGEAFMSATAACATRKPELYVSSVTNNRNYVYFQQTYDTGDVANSYELVWARKVEGICSVFKVVGCRKGGGQFLGRSPLWQAAERSTYSYPVVYPSAFTAFEGTTRYYLNGERRENSAGYAYSGSTANFTPEARTPQVAELHFDGELAYAQGFSAQQDSAKGRNGNQDLYELIVYTNRLTDVERLAVTGYLMKKWLGSEIDFETVGDVARIPTLTAGRYVGLSEGTEAAVDTVSGEGTVRADGNGHLYLADCHSDATSLEVGGGTVSIRSVEIGRDLLPSGAVLHLDAADESTYLGKHVTDGDTYLTQWGSVGGGASVTARNPTTTSKAHPKVVPNKLNGLPMVDFGPFNYGKCDSDMIGETMKVQTFFTVVDSSQGGGYLFGDSVENCYTAGANGYYGFIRYPTGLLTDSIVYSVYSATATGAGPGGTKTRLNGVEVDGTKSYFTGGNDLLSIQCREQFTGDSISCGICNGPNYRGGKMVGELIYYDRRLTNEEAMRVEAYLNAKWFGAETPLYRPARLATLDVADGATVAVVGGGPLVISSCAGEGTVQGALRFAEDADWTVAVGADGVSSALTVTGTFDVSSVGRLVLSGTGKAAVGSYVLATTGGIIGDVSSIVIDSSAANGKRSYSLRQDGNDVVLDVQPFGLMMLVR